MHHSAQKKQTSAEAERKRDAETGRRHRDEGEPDTVCARDLDTVNNMKNWRGKLSKVSLDQLSA